MLDYALRSGEKYYLEVNGDKYEIIGVLDDAYQTFALGEIIMFYDCLGAQSKEFFCIDLYHMTAYSDESFKYESDKDIAEQYSEISARAKKSKMDISLVYPEKEGYEADWYRLLIKNLKSLFCALVFAFSVFNCISISILWIKHRMNEYSVRKAFGYSTFKLILHAVKELVPLVLISAILTLIIQTVIIFVFGAGWVKADNISLLIITMLLTVVFAMIVPFGIIAKVKPATGIKEL